ncbi:MAG TPA: aminotransferase class I/II-fold pyridoxal phosphate-dependent enzyme, partial [Candidatus Limnocylindrales bacterium]|nr:aminotransferase class I/II-fold pyridoxal phosphate-dependent enzyme [Candidatus Limnocylindrales bacterium]
MKLPPFQLERFYARWEFAAPYQLSASDVEGVPIAELLALADDDGRKAWDSLTLGYTESAGAPALRAEIAALYETIDADDVLVFSGAEEALFALLNVLSEAGAELVVQWPGYQSLDAVPRSAGAVVRRFELRHENGWAVDDEGLAAHL